MNDVRQRLLRLLKLWNPKRLSLLGAFGLLFLLAAPYAQDQDKIQKIEKEKKKDQVPLPLQADTDPEFESDSVERLFWDVRDGIFQIKIARNAPSPKASYGTAFAVDNNGLLITNYHVIAPVFFASDEDPLSVFLMTEEGPLEASIAAIDTTHDLALISLPRKLKKGLKISMKSPQKGQKIYSLGIPRDLNVSIAEGNFNGTLLYGPYEQLHMSTPINSGMSGGPTLNRYGEVIGVNVSFMVNSQNISFSVPVKFVRRLLTQRHLQKNLKDKNKAFAQMEEQLFQVQEALMKQVREQNHQTLMIEDWRVLKAAADLKCWSFFRNDPRMTYSRTHHTCSTGAKTYLKDGIYVGEYDWQVSVFRNKTRNSFQFFHVVNEYYNYPHLTLDWSNDLKDLMSRKVCSEFPFMTKNRIPVKVNYCLQSLKRFPKLYFMAFKVVSLMPMQEAFIMKGQLKGFTSENLQEFLRYHLSHLDYAIAPPAPTEAEGGVAHGK